MNVDKNIAILLLAAGESSRMGRPKQLLMYKGQTLLQRSIDAAVAVKAGSVLVVLGANASIIESSVSLKNVYVTINDQWKEGMATSIKAGIKFLIENKIAVDAILILMVDQPYIDSDLLEEIIHTYRTSGKKIIYCSYREGKGPPALFDKAMFEDLLQLEGNQGGKRLIEKYSDQATSVEFPLGYIDIDTMVAYTKLIAGEEGKT